MNRNRERKHIADICEKASSNIALNKLEGVDGDYPVYGASGFVQNVDFYQRDTEYIGIVKDGSGVGRVNTYPAYSSLLGTMQYILPKDGYLLSFVSYALKSLNLASFASGAAIPHIYFKDYSKCQISVPPLSEQSHIVAELDLLTGIIDKQNAQLKELDNLAQAIFYDMFGDPIENEKGWNVSTLENVTTSTCTLSYGIVQTGDDVENGIPVVRPIDMYDTYVTLHGLKKTTKEISDAYKRTILKGTELLLCIRGATGIVSMASKELRGCNVGRNIVPIDFSSSVICVFAYYIFKTKSMFQEIQNKTHGIALQGINVKDVRKLPIILPPLTLQQSFAEKIQSIEKQKEAIRASIADTQKLLDYTMDKYFG